MMRKLKSKRAVAEEAISDDEPAPPAGDGAQAKGYRVPVGGLFELVACPHYLCEVVAWTGAALAAPSMHTSLVAVWVLAMLSGRSAATTRWYRELFGNAYPSSRRHILPYIF